MNWKAVALLLASGAVACFGMAPWVPGSSTLPGNSQSCGSSARIDPEFFAASAGRGKVGWECPNGACPKHFFLSMNTGSGSKTESQNQTAHNLKFIYYLESISGTRTEYDPDQLIPSSQYSIWNCNVPADQYVTFTSTSTYITNWRETLYFSPFSPSGGWQRLSSASCVVRDGTTTPNPCTVECSSCDCSGTWPRSRQWSTAADSCKPAETGVEVWSDGAGTPVHRKCITLSGNNGNAWYDNEFTTALLIGKIGSHAASLLPPSLVGQSCTKGDPTAFAAVSGNQACGAGQTCRWRAKVTGTIAGQRYAITYRKLNITKPGSQAIPAFDMPPQIVTAPGTTWYYPSEEGELLYPPGFVEGACPNTWGSNIVSYTKFDIALAGGTSSVGSNPGAGSAGGGGHCLTLNPSILASPCLPGHGCTVPSFNCSFEASFRVGMGKTKGGSAGEFFVAGNTPSETLALPEGLIFSSGTDTNVGVEVIRGPGLNTDDPVSTAIRQVVTPEAFAVINQRTNASYEITIYRPEARGEWSANTNVYAVVNAETNRIAAWQVEGFTNVYNLYQLNITDNTYTNAPRVWSYQYDSTNKIWGLATPGATGTSQITRGGDTATNECTETSQVLDVDENVIQEQATTSKVFEWGEAVIRQRTGLGAEARTNVTSYYETFAAAGYAASSSKPPVYQVLNADGSWQRYLSYDTNGRPTVVLSAYLNQGPTDTASFCRSTEYSYTPVDGADDGSVRPDSPRKVTEKIKGYTVGLTYYVYLTNETRTIRCRQTTALPGASDNLVSISKTYTNAEWAGRPLSDERPDGTMTIYSYSTNDAGFETNIVASGQPNGGKTGILNGEQTTTVTGSLGEVISVEVHNVVNGQVGYLLSRELYSNFDAFHRSTMVTYLDGTYETNSYDCCGLEKSRARDGVETVYLYEPDTKRQYGVVRGGVVTANDVDAAGRTTRAWRSGTDSSVMTLRRMGYDTAGQLTRETNALNGVTGYTNYVDASGHAVRVTTDPAGGQRIETAYRDGSPMSTTGSGAFPVYYESDAYSGGTWSKEIKGASGGADWVKTYTDMLGRTWKTEYSDGAASTNFYNAIGQLEKTVDPDGVTTLYTYNTLGQAEKTILDMNRNGVGTDSVDRVTRTTNDVVQVGSVVYRRARSYQTADNGAEVLTGEGLSSADGNTTVSLAYGLATTNLTTFDAANLRRTNITVMADGSRSVSVYTNGVLAQAKQLDAGGATLGQTDFAYDPHGLQWKVIDLRNGATTLGYNAADLVATNTTPAPAAGQAALVTKTFFDAALRATNVIHPDNTSTFSVYHTNGLLKTTWGSRIYPVEYAYDHAGRMTNMTTWQNFNETTGQGISGAAVTTWVFDSSRGWLNQKKYHDNTGPSYTYTPAGRLGSRSWVRGITTWYTNNNAGELWVVNYSDSTPDVTYTYDRRGRQTSVAQNGATTITRNLGDAGLVLWESYSGGSLSGFGVTNVYDQFLRRTNVATAGVSTGYRYDGASRLSRVLDGANAVGYSYVANSPLLGQIAFTNSGVQRMLTTKTHDYVNRLTGIASVSASATASSGYAYNSASQRSGVTNSDNSYWVYTYDSMGQVTSGKKYFSDGTPVAGQQFDYAFDDIGNRQTAARDTSTDRYVNNLLNQITARTNSGYVNVLGTATNTATVTVNNQPTARKGDYYRTELLVTNGSTPVWLGVTNIAVLNQGANPDIVATVTGNVFVAKSPEICGCDADGNMTNDGRWFFTWDAENRLKQVESLTSGPTASKRKVVWEFDGQGRRIRQTTYDGSSGSYVVKEDLKLISDGWAHIAELNGTNNALVRSYVWGLDLSGSQAGAGGVGGLLIVKSVGNGTNFYAYDGNGNVAALVKATDGSETARYEYGPFGEALRATGTMAKENPFRFSTKRADNGTDLVLYEYRLYSPSMGRWLSRDPAEEVGGFNLYSFSANEPVSLVDVLGLECLIKRDSKNSRATAACCKGDTIDDLAKQIMLQASPNSEYKRWLKAADGKPLPKSSSEAFTETRRFTIPNEAHITQGRLNSRYGNLVVALREKKDKLAKVYSGRGYKVVDHYTTDPDGQNYSDIKNLIAFSREGTSDVYVWAHYGHGVGNAGNISLTVDATIDKTLSASVGSFLPMHHHLREVMLYSCMAGKGSWITLVAPGGSLWATDEIIFQGAVDFNIFKKGDAYYPLRETVK